MSAPTEVAPGIHRLGSYYANWYVVEDGGAFTVVDTGVSGYWPQLLRLLDDLGASLSHIEAVLLTHSHADHMGNAERIRTDATAPVWIHASELGRVTDPDRSPPRAPLWRWRVLRYFAHLVRNGVTSYPAVAAASTFDDGEVLDVPGRPRVVHTPGHTVGSCALHLAERRALLAGDALATRDIRTSEDRPCLPPAFVNEDSEQALVSLGRLEPLEADVVLVGHGDPWTGGVSEAVRLARRAGIR